MLKTSVQTLRAALLKALIVCERRVTIPILAHARMVTEAGVLTISTTDLDSQVDVEALVDVTREVSTEIDPRQLLGILRFLPPSDAVELVVEGTLAFLSWRGGKARSYCLLASDFPDFKEGGHPILGRMMEADFAAMRRLTPFISNEETRYYLTGICIDQMDDQAIAVATDGHRLGTLPLSDEFGVVVQEAKKPIIPRTAVNRILRLDIGEGNSAAFWRGDNDGVRRFEIKSDGLRFRTKTIDGVYPDWRRVIPNGLEDHSSIELNRVDLLHALRIVTAISRDDYAGGLLVIDSGRVQFQSKKMESELAFDIGPAPANVSAEIGVNTRYLFELVSSARGATITVKWVGHMDPLSVIGSEAVAGENMILMPLRANNGRTSFSAPLREAA